MVRVRTGGDAVETQHVASTEEHGAAPALRIRLLGGFQVQIDGTPVPEGAWRLRKARSLVKLLALTPGQRLPREQVMEALWPDLDIAAAANNLRVALHAARRALAPYDAISSQDGALAFQIEGGLWIDTAAFEQAVAVARLGGTLADFSRALDLYGGELLPMDRFEDWSVAQRDYLHGLSLTLLRDLAARYAEARDWSAAITTLQRLLIAEPTHEEAHVALMRAYALAGQRPRALQQWEHLVATLRRELDAAPDVAARRLHAAITAGTFPAAERPGASGRDAQPRHNLPIPTTALIGRDGELAALKTTLAAHRLVTLTGAGGCGKTRLSLAVATDLLPTYAGNVWFVDLAPLAAAEQVPAAVANALGVREGSGRTLQETLTDRLARQATLLVIDNCEHQREACAALVSHLLAACPDLHLLATSRVALGMQGEAVWRVPSLRVPSGTARQRLAELAAVPAVQLFVERARKHRPNFTLTDEHSRAVIEITRFLDGIPLALELAAARVAILTPEQIAARLGDALGVLTGGRATVPRQRTLRATLTWSYGLLMPSHRVLLARMGIFAEGSDLEAIEAVCADRDAPPVPPDGHLPQTTILDALAALAEHSFIRVDEAGSVMRYRLLETVRQFAAEQLTESGERATMRTRHADYYEALVEAATPHLTGAISPEWLARLERDHDNLRAVLRWLIDGNATARALGLTGRLWRLWYFGGHPAEGRRWCDAAFALPGADDPAVAAPLARSLHGAARLAHLQGDYQTTEVLGTRALALLHPLGDRRESAAVAVTLGNAAYARQRHAEAGEHFAASLGHYRALDDRTGIASALNGLGLVAMDLGDYAAATAHHEEALATLRALGDSLRIALSLNNLAIVVEYGGDAARAEALYRESLGRYRELGSQDGLAQTHDNLGVTLRGRGDYAGAVPHHEAALALWRTLGNRQRTALALINLGTTLSHLGEPDRAQALQEEGLGHARALGNVWLTALALENLGRLAWARGDRARATTHTGESLALYRQIDHSGGIITTLGDLGRAAQTRGEHGQAFARYREGLSRCERANDRSRLPAALEGLALLLAERSEHAGATQLLAAAAALRTAIGKPPTPDQQVAVSAALADLRVALGDATFVAAWGHGRDLTADAALAAALALVAASGA